MHLTMATFRIVLMTLGLVLILTVDTSWARMSAEEDTLPHVTKKHTHHHRPIDASFHSRKSETRAHHISKGQGRAASDAHRSSVHRRRRRQQHGSAGDGHGHQLGLERRWDAALEQASAEEASAGGRVLGMKDHTNDNSNPALTVIPAPREVRQGGGETTLSLRSMEVCFDAANIGNANYARAMLGHGSGQLSVSKTEENLAAMQVHCAKAGAVDVSPLTDGAERTEGGNTGRLQLTLRSQNGDSVGDEMGPEGYWLEVDAAGIKVAAPTPAGVFHGLQTFRQLLPPTVVEHSLRAAREGQASKKDGATSGDDGHRLEEEDRDEAEGEDRPSSDVVTLPQVHVRDWPSYAWRGMHLDVARHFFDVDYIKKFVDSMALHKYNRLQLHLTDDQGWRLPSQKYPKLTTVGSLRRAAIEKTDEVRNLEDQADERGMYGGAYSRDQIKDIIEYARKRFVQIVPEVEMPGHVQAAVAAYPDLSCKKKHAEHNVKVWTDWGVSQESLCVCHENAVKFMEDVLDETMELFDSKYIHVGGDEAVASQWATCDACEKIMKAHKMKKASELQGWFTRRIKKHIEARGRRMVAWDEIMSGKDDEIHGTTVTAWRGQAMGTEAVGRGLEAIVCPTETTYFDRFYDNQDTLGRFEALPVHRTYFFEPASPVLTDEEQRSKVLGSQGCVWTEALRQPAEIDYMTHPRMSALGEVLWTPPGQRSWSSFVDRQSSLNRRYEAMGVSHHIIRNDDVTAGLEREKEASQREPTLRLMRNLERDLLGNSTRRRQQSVGLGLGPHGGSSLLIDLEAVDPVEFMTRDLPQRDSAWFAEAFDVNGLPL